MSAAPAATPPLVHLHRPAMATTFEVWLPAGAGQAAGADPEHLEAVATAALDEVARLEALLSRHDPTAEVARVNREASFAPVRVDVELFALLEDCRRRFTDTGGAFDVCAGSGRRFADDVELDADTRTVRFTHPDARIDLGGYGKGYALDAAGRIFDAFGVTSALAHGGTSSVLARGVQADETPWRIDLRDPFGGEPKAPVAGVALTDAGLSSSAVLHPGRPHTGLIDPRTGRAPEPAGCAVVAPTALDAEVWSTALLVMGRDRAARFVRERLPDGCRAAWIERADGGTTLTWLETKPT